MLSILKVLYHFFKPNLISIALLIISLFFYLNITSSIAKFIEANFHPLLTWGGFNPFLFFSQITLSLLEISFYSLIVLILLFFYLVFRQQGAKAKILFKVLIVISIIFLHWFYLTWGYAYQLSYPIGEIGNFKPTTEEIQKLKNDIINSLEQFSSHPKDISIDSFVPDILQLMDEYLISLNYEKNRQITNYHPRIKTFSIIPHTMKLFGAVGVYNPLFFEIHVNEEIPFAFKVFTLIHEISHARGITSEYQANVIAYEISRKYDNDLVQYSFLLNVSLYMLAHLNKEEKEDFLNRVPIFFKKDILDYYAYWSDVFNPIVSFNQWAYDMYLKKNGIEDGIKSYGRFISYIIYREQFIKNNFLEESIMKKKQL